MSARFGIFEGDRRPYRARNTLSPRNRIVPSGRWYLLWWPIHHSLQDHECARGKIRPNRAYFPFSVSGPLPEKAVYPFFLFPVEKRPYNHPLWKNTKNLPPFKLTPRSFASSQFRPRTITRPGPGTATGTRIRAPVFPGRRKGGMQASSFDVPGFGL